MDFTIISDFVINNGIWCALFVWLFYTSRSESKERETRLTAIVETQGEKLTEISNTLSIISERIDKIETLEAAEEHK